MNQDEDQEGLIQKEAEALIAMKEHEVDRRPPKKRSSSPQDHDGRPSPQQRTKVPLDAKRLEARRKSNRLSARKARLRTKTTIRELEEGQMKLRATNEALRIQLEDALLQNQVLRRMMEEEHQEALASNLAMQRMLERRAARRCHEQVPQQGFPTITPPSPLIQQASFESSVPSQRPTFMSSGTENDMMISSSSDSQDMESSMSAEARMHYLQQEIKALRESIQNQY